MASIVVIGLVLLLDILAFVLAIGTERRRSTAGGIGFLNLDWGNWVQAQLGEAEPSGRRYCVYDMDASTWYGISALALLLLKNAGDKSEDKKKRKRRS
uniref:Uncharacterized protein n=1 Tax=Aegilops tauschii TaxID=37682 RepID=M8BK45_AEGTA